MVSALAVLPWLAFLLLITLAEISTMGGVWWRPEPCRCLFSHFWFCLDSEVPVPSCSHIAGLVRVVTAALTLGLSGFLRHFRASLFFVVAVASVALPAFSFAHDGTPDKKLERLTETSGTN